MNCMLSWVSVETRNVIGKDTTYLIDGTLLCRRMAPYLSLLATIGSPDRAVRCLVVMTQVLVNTSEDRLMCNGETH